MSEFREVAREEPEAVERFAEKVGGDLGQRMLAILHEEQEGESR